jgi:Fe-S oxidoreductase
MCPSYRATLDERHSTRGRANAVRVAVTNQEQPDFNSKDVKETLNLCLSCKACKTECPSNVDISELKAEYYAQNYRQNGAPLSAKIIGHVRKLNRLASITPGIANFVANLKPVRAISNRVMNLHPKRSLPPFAPSLYRWFGKRKVDKSAKPRVVLWPDCFMTYSEPNIGIAATKALEAFGYAVELPAGGCCGRPMMSQGLLADATKTADATLEKMRHLITDPGVVAIIVFEPSCLSAIQDEWLKLKLKTERPLREMLSAKSMLIEQFIESRWDQHPIRPAVKADATDMILHGHCHQKALWGETSTLNMLNRLTNGRVTAIPSTCCGMAGAFGYTKDRYDLSMQIGELSVFPAVRAASDQTTIVVPGTSCRHQIHDGTGKHGLHPAEVLAKALGL